MGLAVGIIIQGIYLIQYTTFITKTVSTAKEQDSATDDQISVLLVNVKMKNRTAQLLLNTIELKDPDLIITMEIDDWWVNQLKAIEGEYKFTQKMPNNVAYGMCLYSKFPLENSKVNYLQNKRVPSFENTIQLENGNRFILHSIHPVPPTLFEDLPDNEGEKEVTLMKIGEKVKMSNLPAIVAGDINDVSWGATDELTHTENLLYDIRVGRGFFNSYNANNLLMRWPLDHFLVTKEFRVIALERMPNIGSDHFPIYSKFSLSPE
ncbi:endonuclease/exonuclease/phosphatase family protein [uncultured Cyclobacterium sp.]|uniref:endonuclease/exonuclease/phosphatase family protein n=1 Tax=uncultured Cyclobacterium sp. TaxID=453820 RepID=UPI0030ED4C82|tara:strand:+ start:101709 stop:102500 length:792 start_codon:yes stop_codon:yes gene_type:complete